MDYPVASRAFRRDVIRRILTIFSGTCWLGVVRPACGRHTTSVAATGGHHRTRTGRGLSSPYLVARVPTRQIHVEHGGYESTTIPHNFRYLELVEFLGEHLVPYIRCEEKCTASGICPLTLPDPQRPGRLSEFRCGYQTQVMKHFFRWVLPEIRPRSKDKMLRLVRAAP